MATSSAIARRYAQAYFDVGRQARDIEGFGEALRRVAGVLVSPEATAVLSNPRVPSADRMRMAMALTEEVAEPARNLARLLVEHNRLPALPELVQQYQRLADAEAGRVRAEVVTAVPVDPPLEDTIRSALSEQLGGEVETSLRQDPDIIGGMVIRVGDRVIDGSVRTRLQQLQAALA